MFNLNRQTDYALVAMARLATSAQGEPISARAIAEDFDLPLQGLMNILKDLHRAGLVNSIRGVKGGYVLASDADAISVADVIEAIEGPPQLAPCCDETDDGDECITCQLIAKCPISSAIRDLSGQINQFLSRVTIADLLASQTSGPLPQLMSGYADRTKLTSKPGTTSAPVQVNVRIGE